MMKRLTISMCLITLLSTSACNSRESGLKEDMNGFVMGDDKQAPKPLIVGVGETVDRFLARNPFLQTLKIPGKDYVLNLPLLTRTDATYDDGEIKFHVGCSFTTNIDGNREAVGINSVGFQLCDPAINDWKKATRMTAALITQFENQNPNLTSLLEFRKNHSLIETEKVWSGVLYDPWTKIEFPLSEKSANQFFEKESIEGHVQQLQFNQGSYVVMAAFMNNKISIHFGITKTSYWGGENLTEEQKKTMKYQTVISVLQRKSAAKPCTTTQDWLRCVP